MSTPYEKIYYQSQNVLITSTRAEMAGKTFVMSNITSVNLATISPSTGCATLLFVLGASMLVGGIFEFVRGNTDLIVISIVGLILSLLGYFWVKSLKTEYAVNLSSASGETRIMQSTNKKQIEDIVAAIKQAVIDSGIQKVEAVAGRQIAESGDDTLLKLKTLKSMLDTGVITTQEYETKKTEILSKM
jgi:hypothetical protein